MTIFAGWNRRSGGAADTGETGSRSRPETSEDGIDELLEIAHERWPRASAELVEPQPGDVRAEIEAALRAFTLDRTARLFDSDDAEDAACVPGELDRLERWLKALEDGSLTA